MTLTQSNIFPSVDPASLLDLATDLARLGSAAALRSAGDRAYYAAFLTTRDELTRKNYSRFTDGPTAHTQVREALRSVSQHMGISLNRLRLARNALTYQTGPVALQRGRTLQWMLDTARNIVNFVNALPERA